jgi:hypothetical protein
MDEIEVSGEPPDTDPPSPNPEQIRRDLTQTILMFFSSHAEIRGAGGGGGAGSGGGFGERLGAMVREFVDQVVETIETEGGRTDGPRATGPQEHE